MKTEIIHEPDCASNNNLTKCDCCPRYTIQKIEDRAYDVAMSINREHEGQTDEIQEHYVDGAAYVKDFAIEILKLKMNPECHLSAKEYWYLCGIHDAIRVLQEF